MNTHPLFFLHTLRRGPLLAVLAVGLSGCSSMGVGIGIPVGPFSIGVGVGIPIGPVTIGVGASNSGVNLGVSTGVDVWKIQDVAEDLVVPIMDFPIRIDRDALTLGYAGVYGSFLLFAKRAEKKYGVPARDILVEMGRRGMVGGQEDMIEDTAMTMARERGLTLTVA